jgi:Predicted SAM-dependent methyltransferases
VRHIAPRRLLNCFAYTCRFLSVRHAGGGTTLNIDVSKRSLTRGRENFALNNLPTMDHRFIADDVRAVLPRLARRGEKFEAIILDPPTFHVRPEQKGSRSKRISNSC